MYKNHESEEGKVSYTNKELSELIHMPEATISKCNRTLQKKGYLEGSNELTKRFQLRKLDQLFIWKFKQQDERITKVEETLNKVLDENKQLRTKIEQLEKQQNKKYVITL